MPPLLLAFVIATVVWTVASLALSLRQSAHVAARRDDVPADFTDRVDLEAHRKAADYTVARERLARLEGLVGSAVALAWALGGIAVFYGVVAALVPEGLWRGVAFLTGAGLVTTLTELPFSIYRAFVLEEAFGFNRTTPAAFAVDRIKSLAISFAVTVPLLAMLLWVMRNVTGLWWLWAWAGLVMLMIAAPTVYIRFIAPRFNRFVPLEDQGLRERLESLLQRSGFRSSGLYVMDASRRSTHGNAFFIGFGRTKRIVLFDTLLARSTPEEVEAVVAHELGHFRHGHILFGLARAALLSLVALAAFGWLCKQPWLLPAFDIPDRDDALSLYVCMLLAGAIGPFVAPIGNWISRRNEFQADAYARRSVGAAPLIDALTALARDNAATLTPDPLYALVHHSHPPVPLRVRRLRDDERRDAAMPPARMEAGAA